MKCRFRLFAVACASAIVLFTASVHHAVAESRGDARTFVEHVATQVVTNINDTQITDEQRRRRYGEIFDYALDIPLIARIAMGHHLRSVSPTQRKQYFTNFRHYIIEIYADRFGGHRDAKLEVLSEIQSSKDITLVYGKISEPRTSPKDTVFQVRSSDQGYKIVDVTINGVSLVLTKRSEFNSIVYNHGVRELIDALAVKRVSGADPTRVFEAF